jgi:hypothetical protein
MNSNPSTPDPSPRGGAGELNDAVMQKLKSYRWKGRVLTGLALSVGLLAIAAGVVLAWANAMMVRPMERLLLQDYPSAVGQADTNSSAANGRESRPQLSRAELDWRHVQVTAAHGKALFLTAASVALLGVGTFFTLLLVIFNRQVTLHQINASLALISNQIRELKQKG